MAAGIPPFVQSFKLGGVPDAKFVAEIASRSGDTPGLPFEEGVWTVGGEGLAEEPMGLNFPLLWRCQKQQASGFPHTQDSKHKTHR